MHDNPLFTTDDGAPQDASVLEAQLAECQKQRDEYMAGWQRAKADFVNREREYEKQRADLSAFLRASVVRALLVPMSELTHACASVPAALKDAVWAKGIASISGNFEKAFAAMGVVRMDTVGKPFDPMRHEVIAKRPADGVAPETIVEEVGPGYLLEGKTLIPAKVIIADEAGQENTRSKEHENNDDVASDVIRS